MQTMKACTWAVLTLLSCPVRLDLCLLQVCTSHLSLFTSSKRGTNMAARQALALLAILAGEIWSSGAEIALIATE